MPVALARLDMHHVADGDLALFALRRGEAFAGRDDENLIAVMDMPAGGRADAKIDHVAAKVVRLPLADDAWRVRLTAPPVQPAIGVAVSIGVSLRSLILSTRIIDLLRTRNDLSAKNTK